MRPVTATDGACRPTATRIAQGVRDGELSCVEVAQAHLERITSQNASLKAFSFVDDAAVMAHAVELDRVLAQSGPLGPLHGVPVGVKDLIFTRDQPTVGGSTAYEGFTPDQDDVVVQRLRDAGALVIGKTNVPTFGFGPGTSNPLTGTTLHPDDPALSPGGSSGGSAVAVASGMCPVALGSDGGGSIRIPAALCGVLGMKPTFGLVPLHPGCRDSSFPGFSAWETLEHIGPMARTAADLALLLGVIVGLDTRDRHSVPSPFAGFTLRSDVMDGLRVGVCFDLGGDGGVSNEARDGVLRCVDVLGRAGATVESVTVDLPPLGDPFGAIAALEADLAGLRDLVAAHPDGLNARILRMLDRDWSFDEVADAVRVRKDVSNALNGLLRQVDVLVTPCVPTVSVPLDPPTAGANPSDAADPQRLSGFTMPFNFTGHPALSLPVAVAGRPRPVGVQLVADRFRDDLLLSVASVVLAELDRDTEVRAS